MLLKEGKSVMIKTVWCVTFHVSDFAKEFYEKVWV